MDRNLPHLIPTDTASTEAFTSPRSARPQPWNIPARQPHAHGAHLLQQLNQIENEAVDINRRRIERGLEEGGLILEFESDPNADLIYESLENLPKEIELLKVSVRDNRVTAVVYVPEGKLSFFIQRVEKYLQDPLPAKKRKYSNIIDSIANVRRAVVRSLWTDDGDTFPRNDAEVWWEVWLRSGNDADAAVQVFRNIVLEAGMEFRDQRINFVDRTVLLIKTRESILQDALDLLDVIAELRRARVSSNEYIEVPSREQRERIDSILERLTISDQPSCALSLLDTGVNNGHPLIQPFLNNVDLHLKLTRDLHLKLTHLV